MARHTEQKLEGPGLSLKGRVYQYGTRYGVVSATWPKKRGKVPAKKQHRGQRLFTEACAAIKRLPAEFQIEAAENAKGTPMLPRDALMAALFGRGPAFVMRDGATFRPMPVRVDLTSLLDNLAWDPGSMLFRGQYSWLGVPPGQPGNVLVYRGSNQAPSWQPPPNANAMRITTAIIENDLPASTVWPRIPSFGASLIDTAGAIDPAQPTRLYVPEGATAVRLHAKLVLSASNDEGSVLIQFRDDQQNSRGPAGSNFSVRQANIGYSDNQFSVSSPWVPADLSAWYDIRVNIWPQTSLAFRAGSTFGMEVL